jgi:hypothetical protein
VKPVVVGFTFGVGAGVVAGLLVGFVGYRWLARSRELAR